MKANKHWKSVKNYGTKSDISLDQQLITQMIMEIKVNSYNDLPLKKTLELYDMTIFVRSFFMKAANTIYNFLGKLLHKLFFFSLGFTPCKVEQPLQGMELQEKETQKD